MFQKKTSNEMGVVGSKLKWVFHASYDYTSTDNDPYERHPLQRCYQNQMVIKNEKDDKKYTSTTITTVKKTRNECCSKP